jgi:hypothetical protein
MRAIVIDPKSRTIYELPFHMAPDFMRTVASFIGSNALGIDAAPPHTAMFLDAIAFLREGQAFWRQVGGNPATNVGGVGIMFGLGADGKLVDLPAAITVDGLREKILWVDDVIVNTIERMQIVDLPTGKAPAVAREFVWRAGAVTPASEAQPSPDAARTAVEAAGDADVYAQGSQPAPAAPSPATHAAAKAPEAAPAAPLAPIWAIHETPDNRYRLIEYEVTEKGLGAVLSLATVQNLDEARARVPKGLFMRPAEDDIEDDTLVETWS